MIILQCGDGSFSCRQRSALALVCLLVSVAAAVIIFFALASYLRTMLTLTDASAKKTQQLFCAFCEMAFFVLETTKNALETAFFVLEIL